MNPGSPASQEAGFFVDASPPQDGEKVGTGYRKLRIGA